MLGSGIRNLCESSEYPWSETPATPMLGRLLLSQMRRSQLGSGRELNTRSVSLVLMTCWMQVIQIYELGKQTQPLLTHVDTMSVSFENMK